MKVKPIFRLAIIMCILGIVISSGIVLNYAYTNQLSFIPYPKQKYIDLINFILKSGYKIVLPRDLTRYVDSGEKIAIIVHDVDLWPSGSSVFVDVERQFNVKSAFYLRPDATYFTHSIAFFQNLQANGWEIGFHYDSLAESDNNKTLGTQLFIAQLLYLRTFFNITTVRAHGDSYNDKIDSHHLFNQTLFDKLHITDYSGLPHADVIQDTWHQWSQPPLTLPLVLVLMHSDWWNRQDDNI